MNNDIHVYIIYYCTCIDEIAKKNSPMMGKDMLWYIEGLMQIKVVYSTSSLYYYIEAKSMPTTIDSTAT